MTSRIYPLRGTNERRLQCLGLRFLHLSPTGDEQTPFCFVGSSSPLFIPYGGRINMKIRAFVRNKSIYPLRGTNKLFGFFGAFDFSHLSPTGDERTFTVASSVVLALFIPCGGRTNITTSEYNSSSSIYPLRGTNEPQHD